MHLIVVLMNLKAGVEMKHVTYKGSAAVAVAVGSDEITMGIVPVTTMAPYVQQGRVRAIAVTGPKRTALLPEIPALAETITGIALDPWFAVLAPAKTPRAIVDRLNQLVNQIIRSPEIVNTKLTPAGIEAK